MAWEIKRIDENETRNLEYWLERDWEPFAVTAENRLKQSYDSYREICYDERVIVSVIWLRKHSESK